jgi:hypothetical protein
MSAIFLAKCPGREREAYGQLREIYLEGPLMRTPTIVTLLRELENTLEIPSDDRLMKREE